MKNKRSVDIFGLSNIFIKQISFELAIPISIIVEKSLKTGKFPTVWKQSIITPVYKNKGKKEEMSNYRPISSIPIFAKILETLVSEDLMIYLEANSIINNEQFGFRKFRSVHHAIISFVNNITMEISKNNNMGCLLLDCEKAFDTVNRNLLLEKLKSYGVLGLNLQWFDSCLNDRSQKVKFKDKISENSITTSIGIIQGSSLSAILFLIYINDIKIQSAERIFLYADDCAANFSLQSENENVIANISKEIDEWYMRNKLALNKNKSELMVFTPKFKEVDNRIRNALSNGENLINNNILKSDVRYLGIFLDNKLNFELSCKKNCATLCNRIVVNNKSKKMFPHRYKIESLLRICSFAFEFFFLLFSKY